MKKFKYKNYKNCYFIVSSYVKDENAMAIAIESDNGPITVCTVYDELGLYCEGITTIKNYGENSNITNFLKKLGIVREILNSFPCNYSYPNSSETKDICLIDMDKLKQYSKEWHYHV